MLELYGDLRESFGWTNAQIDALSWGEVEEIRQHWRRKPTVGAMLRSYFGIDAAPAAPAVDPDAPVPVTVVTDDEMERVLAIARAQAEVGRGSPFR